MRAIRSASVIYLYAAVAVAGLEAQTRMPPDAGVLPNQKTIEVRLDQPSKTLSTAEVQAALGWAMATWNAALPADLKLVATPASAPLPAGAVVFMIRFDNDPQHYGGRGIDEVGDVRGLIDRTHNNAVVAVFLVDAPGAFSTSGAAAARDLQLVVTHELGHALGVQHAFGATSVPPIMAPAIEENGKLLARTKSTLAALRQLTTDDNDLLEIAMLKRASKAVAGSYTGSLTVKEVKKGSGVLAKGSVLPVRDGDFVVSFDAGKVVVVYKGSRRELPAVDLFEPGVTLKFPDVADGRTLRTITVSRGNTPEEIDIDAVIEPSTASYQITGTLKRK